MGGGRKGFLINFSEERKRNGVSLKAEKERVVLSPKPEGELGGALGLPRDILTSAVSSKKREGRRLLQLEENIEE